jgi:hypothetical protein
MRINLILVYTILSVELSIGWLKMHCAHMRACIISLIGAWVHWNGLCSLIICVLVWICSPSCGVGAEIEIAYGDDVPVSGAL